MSEKKSSKVEERGNVRAQFLEAMAPFEKKYNLPASALKQALIELGVSAEDAEIAIASSVKTSLPSQLPPPAEPAGVYRIPQELKSEVLRSRLQRILASMDEVPNPLQILTLHRPNPMDSDSDWNDFMVTISNFLPWRAVERPFVQKDHTNRD